MSPEQAEGERRRRRPGRPVQPGLRALRAAGGPAAVHRAHPAVAVLARQVLDPVPPLTTLRPGVPRSVRRALERALAKSPGGPVWDRAGVPGGPRGAGRARGRAEEGHRRAAVRQSEPRSRQRLLRRRSHGGGDRRPLPGPGAHGDLPHFVGQAQGDRLGPPRVRPGAQRAATCSRAACAGRGPAPDHGAADRRRDRCATSGPRSTRARWTTCSTCRSGCRGRSSRRCGSRCRHRRTARSRSGRSPISARSSTTSARGRSTTGTVPTGWWRRGRWRNTGSPRSAPTRRSTEYWARCTPGRRSSSAATRRRPCARPRPVPSGPSSSTRIRRRASRSWVRSPTVGARLERPSGS